MAQCNIERGVLLPAIAATARRTALEASNSRLSISRVRPSRAAISATRGPSPSAGSLRSGRADHGVVDHEAGRLQTLARLGLDLLRAACRRAIASRIACSAAVDLRRARALLGGQVLVARTHRQAVGLAHGVGARRSRSGTPGRAPCSGSPQLLVVLAAEHGHVRLHLVEQPRDHRARRRRNARGGARLPAMSVTPGTLHAHASPRRRTDTSSPPTAATAASQPAPPARRRRPRACADSGAKSSFGPNWVGLTNTLATTRSACWRASSTSEKCPACRLPMVGTKPTRRPSRFHSATRARSAASSLTMSIMRGCCRSVRRQCSASGKRPSRTACGDRPAPRRRSSRLRRGNP